MRIVRVRMDYTIEDIKNLSAIVQSAVVSLAVLIAGAWALYQFIFLKKISKARIELKEKKDAIKKEPAINLELEVNELLGLSGKLYINAVLSISNNGRKQEVVDWKKTTIRATKINEGKELPEWGQIFANFLHRKRPSLSLTVLPGTKEVESFLIPVDKPGVYFVDVLVALSDETHSKVKKYIQEQDIQTGNLWYAVGIYYKLDSQ